MWPERDRKDVAGCAICIRDLCTFGAHTCIFSDGCNFFLKGETFLRCSLRIMRFVPLSKVRIVRIGVETSRCAPAFILPSFPFYFNIFVLFFSRYYNERTPLHIFIFPPMMYVCINHIINWETFEPFMRYGLVIRRMLNFD